jgi:hypothetical protein
MSEKEYIWLDTAYKPLLYILPEIVAFDAVELDLAEIIELTAIFARSSIFETPSLPTTRPGREDGRKAGRIRGLLRKGMQDDAGGGPICTIWGSWP